MSLGPPITGPEASGVEDPAPAFFFGVLSPYSWFAAERIGDVIPEAVWCPVLAGVVFQAHGRTSWGFTDERAAKIADCEARAAQHGLGPMRWPDPWPTRDLFAGRAMMYARREGLLREFALAAMRLAFLEGVDLDSVPAMREAATRAGLEPQAVEESLSDPGIKDELRAATQRAIDLGVRGVPTVAAGGELFWGDDRLEEAALRAHQQPR